MNTLIYIIIFIMGTVFGSFYTLAVYRIPRKINITHKHSFCPKCNHELGFFELIPILSYIFLGGKCKNCKQKIKIRYLLLEVLSGITFVAIAAVLKVDGYNLNMDLLVTLAFLCLYLVALFIIAGIDKERRYIEKSVLYYALGIATIYIIYLCVIDNSSIYRYAMYLIALVILLIIDNIRLIKKAKESYTISILILFIIMGIMTGEVITISTGIITIVIILLILLIQKIKNIVNKSKKEKIILPNILPIGFYLVISNIVSFIVIMFLQNWILK